jgi:hypothetical protein
MKTYADHLIFTFLMRDPIGDIKKYSQSLLLWLISKKGLLFLPDFKI